MKDRKADPRRYSRVVVDGAKQAPSRAMLRAVGFTDADFEKPQIGVASTWADVTPGGLNALTASSSRWRLSGPCTTCARAGRAMPCDAPSARRD